ncbi:hypothetical protein OY671_008779, partial [Metschnikowia pulcherrima]
RLRTIGRDRGRDDRAPGPGLECRAAQGRQLHPVRTHGQVERGAADRGGDGWRCGFRRRPRLPRGGGCGVRCRRGGARRRGRGAGWRGGCPHRAVACADAGDAAVHLLRAEAAADPETGRGREHHRARCGARARRGCVQHARHQQPGGGGNGAVADAGGATPDSLLRRTHPRGGRVDGRPRGTRQRGRDCRAQGGPRRFRPFGAAVGTGAGGAGGGGGLCRAHPARCAL